MSIPCELDDATRLLRATRTHCAIGAAFLALQLFGNLYEQVVTNVAAIAAPEAGSVVDELAPGSPLFYYLPWAPAGVVLVVALALRLPRLGAPSWVVRRVHWACSALGVAVAVKVVLITHVNPRFRDPTTDVGDLREWAVTWPSATARRSSPSVPRSSCCCRGVPGCSMAPSSHSCRTGLTGPVPCSRSTQLPAAPQWLVHPARSLCTAGVLADFPSSALWPTTLLRAAMIE